MLKKMANFVGRYFGLIIILFAGCGFLFPQLFGWVTGKILNQSIINLLLGFIMLGMGMTLEAKDFLLIVKRPKDVIVGTVAQYAFMPLLGYLLSRLLNLSPELTVGVVLLGCCPGGTASNVICYMAGADVPLSITMTTCSTLLSPILTPWIAYILIGQRVEFDPIAMFLSIVQVVIVPVFAGLLLKTLLKKKLDPFVVIMPAISSFAIALIIAGIMGANKAGIIASIGVMVVVVILHNGLGYLCGYSVAKLFKMDYRKRITVAVEVGMQNSGLSTTLARTSFPSMAMATVPGALFSVWHNISGSILAWAVRSKTTKETTEVIEK